MKTENELLIATDVEIAKNDEIVKQVEDILKNEFPVWYEGGYLPEQGLRNVISKRARQNIVE